MVEISVIVPVYNCEKYLKDTIYSIQQQTVKDLEIILINDGSTDSSGRICDVLSNKDKRIFVLHQENKGVCTARNLGLSIAKGRYVSFIDADDYLVEDMYELLLKNIKKNNFQISICSAKTIFPNGKEINQETGKSYSFTKEEALEKFLKGNFFSEGLWIKLFERDLLCDLEFEDGRRMSEDKYYFFKALLKSENIIFEDIIKYQYVKREDGVTMSKFSEKYFDMIYFSEKIYLETLKIFPGYRHLALSNLYVTVLTVYRKIKIDKSANKKFNMCVKKIKKYLIENKNINIDNLTSNNKIEVALIELAPFLYVGLMKIYERRRFGK